MQIADKKITIKDNQSVFDVAIQEYGNIEASFLIVEDNASINTIDQIPYPGSKLSIRTDDNLKNVATATIMMNSGGCSTLDVDLQVKGSFNKSFNKSFL